jgi:hypothetical protein
MPVTCRLRILLAQLNVERAKNGQSTISLRRIAQESGIAQSVLVSLHTGRSQRVDYATIDRLLSYFNQFYPIHIEDLFSWEMAVTVPAKTSIPAAMLM